MWLDLFAFAAQLRRPDTIIRVRYFTTIVAGEPEAARRQETYLAALTSPRPQVEVVRGKFTIKKFRCFRGSSPYHCDCDPLREYRTYEEKLTDVTSFLISHDHLAASLLPDAVPGRQGQAYHRPDKWR